MSAEGVESTGVRKNNDGTYEVVNAKNDGDNGIYLVDDKGNYDIKTSQSIGYKTSNPFDFMIPNDHTGGYDGHAEVTFNPKKMLNGNSILDSYTSQWKTTITGHGIPESFAAMVLLALESRNNAYYDIKEKYPTSTGGIYTPVVLDGNLTTVRALGNVIFGVNMRTVFKESWDTILDSPTSFYKLNMPIVGWYNQFHNNGNGYNSGFPFYGEHTYSGTNIYRGYFRK